MQTGFTAGGGHVDQVATGIEFQHGVGIGVADSPELFRGQLQIIWEVQGAQGIGCSGQGWQWCGNRHDPGATLDQVRATSCPGRRQLWEPIRGAVRQQPAVVFGLLYKLLFVCEREPRELGVGLAQRSDGIFGGTPLAATRG